MGEGPVTLVQDADVPALIRAAGEKDQPQIAFRRINEAAIRDYISGGSGGFALGGYASPTQKILDILDATTGKTYTQSGRKLLADLRNPKSDEAAILNGLANIGGYGNPVTALVQQHGGSAAEAFATALEAELTQGLTRVGTDYMHKQADDFISLVDDNMEDIAAKIQEAIARAAEGEASASWDKLYKEKFPYSLEFSLAAKLPLALAEVRAQSPDELAATAQMATAAIDKGTANYLTLAQKLALAEVRNPGTLDTLEQAYRGLGGAYAEALEATLGADADTLKVIDDAKGYAELHLLQKDQYLLNGIRQAVHYTADVPTARAGFTADFGAAFKAEHGVDLGEAMQQKDGIGREARAYARDQYIGKYLEGMIQRYTQAFFSKAGLATTRRVVEENTMSFPDLYDVVNKVIQGGRNTRYKQAVQDQATLSENGRHDKTAPSFFEQVKVKGVGEGFQRGD